MLSSSESMLSSSVAGWWPRFWLVPVFLLALYLHYPTYRIWFYADDFAWLGLRQSIQQPADVWHALFSPQAQGTVRFLSERAWFLVLESIGGLNATVFRTANMLALLLAAWLLADVVRRITGSRVAAALSAALWLAQTGLFIAFSWASSINQILLVVFVMGAMRFLLIAHETNRHGYYLLAWATFLLGFGALESNMMFSAMALAWALLLAPQRWKAAAAFLVPTLCFVIVHLFLIPRNASDSTYRMFIDGDLLTTLRSYAAVAFTPIQLLTYRPQALSKVVVFVLAAGFALSLLLALWRSWRVEDRAPLLFFLWSVLLLAPVLPLKNHISHYYLASVAVGLAASVGTLVARQTALWARGMGLSWVLLLLVSGLYVGRSVQKIYFHRAAPVRALVAGVARAAQLHPGKQILLAGMTDDLFWTGFYDHPFRLVGAPQVALFPGEEQRISFKHMLDDIPGMLSTPAAARQAIEENRAIVYQIKNMKLYSVTADYYTRLPVDGIPSRLELGDGGADKQLLHGWQAPEAGFRWMESRAALRLGIPVDCCRKLEIVGARSELLLDKGPQTLELRGPDGFRKSWRLDGPQAEFRLETAVPARWREKKEVVLELSTDRRIQSSQDSRHLALIMQSVGIY
jgi:hypothetical protein